MNYPFINPYTEENNKENNIPKEYAFDFITNKFKKNSENKMYLVEGKEAIKIWIYKCLKTPRGRYGAYTWNFGNDLDTLIASGLTRDAIESEAQRMIKEALLVNKDITNVNDFNIDFYNEKLHASFNCSTKYGDIKIDWR